MLSAAASLVRSGISGLRSLMGNQVLRCTPVVLLRLSSTPLHIPLNEFHKELRICDWGQIHPTLAITWPQGASCEYGHHLEAAQVNGIVGLSRYAAD
jgi:hypothetical protein